MSEASVKPDQPSDQPSEQDPPDEAPLSESSKRKLARLTGMPAVITASLAALVIGIAIGNVARKRIDKLAHGYS